MKPDAMWKSFACSMNLSANYDVWSFCDNEKEANELATLVLEKTKTASASIYELYDLAGAKIPVVGDYSVVTYWSGNACCIVETTKVDFVAFGDVSDEFAYKEGEGDRSLGYWRKCHLDYFSQEMKPYSLKLSEETMVVCEEFKVVYS